MKYLFLVFATATITTIANAQAQFGIKGGLNLSNANVSPKEPGASYNIKPNFHIGLLEAFPLSNDFSLQIEALYSGQGSKFKSHGANDETLSLGYINLPVLLKYNMRSGLFAEIGPQVGFLVRAKDKQLGTSLNVKDALHKIDFSGCLGIGYTSSSNIGFDLRCNLGFVNINKSSDGSLKNEVIQIGIFYLLGEGKKRD